MATWVLDLLRRGGYFALAFLTFLESVFPPVPSELILPLAGYLARQGRLTLWGVAVASALGAVAGALPLYWLGRRAGGGRLERWVGRHGRWVAVTPHELERAQQSFERHQRRAVFLGRLVPGLRSLISIPAGRARMPLPQFVAYTAAGSLVWSGALACAGWALGAGYAAVERVLDPLSWAVLGVVLALYLRRVIGGGGGRHARSG